MAQHTKFVLVTGGVASGVGKGSVTSALGVVLRSHGVRVTAVKVDPHLNVDSGQASAFEPGEVYVLDDGGQVDMDLGEYERNLDLRLTAGHWVTSGKIFEQVITREKSGHYLGESVRMVPHATDAVQDWIADVAGRPVDRSGLPPEVCFIELGGTAGDFELSLYLEALQQLAFKVGTDNFCVVHVTLLFNHSREGDQKTKPTQHSVRMLREAGLKPDFLICRADGPLEDATRRKLSQCCQVPFDCVLALYAMSNIDRAPLLLAEQDVGVSLCARLCLRNDDVVTPVLPLPDAAVGDACEARLGDWRMLADRKDLCTEEVLIAIVGKHGGSHDAYMSVWKALRHAGVEAHLHLEVLAVESADLEANVQFADARRFDTAWQRLRSASAVVLPGGFRDRSVEGRLRALHYCRTSHTPVLCIAAGFQLAVVEFARAELCLESAHSTEFDEATPHPVVVFMPEASAAVMGGTMRLGARTTHLLDEESLAFRLYGGRKAVQERHRHRHEVSAQFVPSLEGRGFVFSGRDDRGQRMSIGELRGHPFFIGAQFHPEFASRPASPAPLVLGLVLAAARRLDRRLKEDGGLLRPGAGFERH